MTVRKKELWENRNPYPVGVAPRLNTVGDFVSAILCDDQNVINYCLWEARQNSATLNAVLRALSTADQPPDSCRKAFLGAWTTQGLWIRDDFSVDPLLPPLLVNLLPGYVGPPVHLFRGERWLNHQNKTYGAAWTTSRESAEMFAGGLNCIGPGGGVLLATTAPTQAILAEPTDHSRGLGEDEYVLDRRKLNHVEVLERFFR